MNKKYILRFLPLFYEELDEKISYIAFNLKNKKAANDLLDSVEKAITDRLEYPDIFEPIYSKKDRKHPYYRIYVKNYIIYYVLLNENNINIMEVRRIVHRLQDKDNKI